MAGRIDLVDDIVCAALSRRLLTILLTTGLLGGCTSLIGIPRSVPPVVALEAEVAQLAVIDGTTSAPGAVAVRALADGLAGEDGAATVDMDAAQAAWLEVRKKKSSKVGSDEAAHICEVTGAAAIVGLQGLKVWDISGSGYNVQSLDGQVQLGAMPGTEQAKTQYVYVGPKTTAVAAISRVVSSTWRITDCTGVALDTTRLVDSAIDPGWGFSLKEAKQALVTAEAPVVIDEMAIMGKAMAARIRPSTVVTERKFYPGLTPEMGDAATLAWEGEWDEAATIWESITEDKAKRQAQIFVNLSVAAEARGDIDGARQYAAKAVALNASKVALARVEDAKALTPDTVPAPKPPEPPAEVAPADGADVAAEGTEAGEAAATEPSASEKAPE